MICLKRVVVTGLGAVTAIGNNVNEFWNNLIDGKSGFSKITRIPIENHDTVVAAECDDGYEELARKYWGKRQLNATTKGVRMALASAGEAVDDCAIDFDKCDSTRIGVIYGVIDNSNKDAERDSPLNIILKEMPSSVAALITMKYNLHGACFSVSSACASSGYAVSIAAQLIECGMYDAMIVGGLSGVVTHDQLNGFNQILAMSTNPDPETACRPFAKNRDGFVMGEGAATLVLESEDFAKRRNAKIYCELAGYGMYSEASNITAPLADGEGMRIVMEKAILKSGLSVDEIDCINAHGTSTIMNDSYETMAIKNLFGEKAYSIPVSSIKSSVGHTLAAASAIEAVASVKTIETGIIPPTIHYDEPDDELDLDYVPNKARHQNVNTVLSNSFGFGGQDISLIFKKY